MSNRSARSIRQAVRSMAAWRRSSCRHRRGEWNSSPSYSIPNRHGDQPKSNGDEAPPLVADDVLAFRCRKSPAVEESEHVSFLLAPGTGSAGVRAESFRQPTPAPDPPGAPLRGSDLAVPAESPADRGIDELLQRRLIEQRRAINDRAGNRGNRKPLEPAAVRGANGRMMNHRSTDSAARTAPDG